MKPFMVAQYMLHQSGFVSYLWVVYSDKTVKLYEREGVLFPHDVDPPFAGWKLIFQGEYKAQKIDAEAVRVWSI